MMKKRNIKKDREELKKELFGDTLELRHAPDYYTKELEKDNRTEMLNNCACSIHIQTDKQVKDPIPCIGHGKNCPCTKALNELQQEKKEEVTPQPAS